jgi:hypothetical protein
MAQQGWLSCARENFLRHPDARNQDWKVREIHQFANREIVPCLVIIRALISFLNVRERNRLFLRQNCCCRYRKPPLTTSLHPLAMADKLDCALDLMRRLPPAQIEDNLAGLIDLVPDLTEELLSAVDQPLKIAYDSHSKRDYLLCDYNRDEDSYRYAHLPTYKIAYLM